MRITYIHQHFKTPVEAGGTRHYEFARRLARDGHKVTVICGGAEHRSYKLDGIQVVQVRSWYENGMSFRRRMVAMAQFMIMAIPETVRHPADVVFATSTPLTVAVPAIVTSTIRKARFVFEVRDLWPAVPYELGVIKDGAIYRAARLLESITYARADEVIALSPGMAEGVARTNPRVHTSVIPNASDHELFEKTTDELDRIRRELGWRPDERVAVYAGSFGPTYDVLRWVRIASTARRWRFVIIGEGTLTASARGLAVELGHQVDAILPGRMPKATVAKYIAAADISLSSLDNHPALSVNSLNKVFDALAAGRPVAFTHDGWLPSLLVDVGAGWRLSDDIAEAARELDELGDSEITEAAGAAKRLGHSSFARETLYEHFRKAVLPTSQHVA